MFKSYAVKSVDDYGLVIIAGIVISLFIMAGNLVLGQAHLVIW